jgi:phage tail-like protein
MKQADIERLLPAVFRGSDSLGHNEVVGALLDVMEALQRHPEAILNDFDAWFDPMRAPDEFVPWLAGWVDLDRFFVRSSRMGTVVSSTRAPLSVGLGRLRELIREASFLSKWRGTSKGMTAFLETAVGVTGFVIDEEVRDERGALRPFHVRVSIPAPARAHFDLINRIVRSEKPAHVTCELGFVESLQGE